MISPPLILLAVVTKSMNSGNANNASNGALANDISLVNLKLKCT